MDNEKEEKVKKILLATGLTAAAIIEIGRAHV